MQNEGVELRMGPRKEPWVMDKIDVSAMGKGSDGDGFGIERDEIVMTICIAIKNW